jgi:hypothetical protein
MQDEIKEVLSRSVCGGWDRGFLESILEQLEKGRNLSEKQLDTVTKVPATFLRGLSLTCVATQR